MKNSYKFYEQIIQERGLTSYKVSLASKIPQSAFSLWKLHDIVPKWDRMQKIAAVLSTEEKPLTAEDFYRADAQ